MARKIVGTFCERKFAPKSRYASGSFRWKKSGNTWLLIACPRGQWQPRKKRCKKGTEGFAVLRKVKKGQRCRKGEKRVKKG